MNRSRLTARALAVLLFATLPVTLVHAATWRHEPGADGDGSWRLDRAAWRAAIDARSGSNGATVPLPLPGGDVVDVRVTPAPLFDDPAAAEALGMRDFAFVAPGRPGLTGRLHLVGDAIHAHYIDADGALVSVVPDADDPDRYRVAREVDDHRATCDAKAADAPAAPRGGTNALAYDYAGTLRIYRLAVGATGEFTAANGGTVASAQAAIANTIAAVNVIYERELSIRLALVPNTQAIFTNGTTDPYTSGNTSLLRAENQLQMDQLVGTANYDVGVVFDQSNSGQAAIASVCSATQKGSGAMGGTSVRLAAHELGHMFGGHHSFNDGFSGLCGNGSRDAPFAYEPGSGSTLMSYAGTCDIGDIEIDRDPYFHIVNLEEMVNFVRSGDGSECGTVIATGNRAPTIAVPPGVITIPKDTPFRLAVTPADVDAGDTVQFTIEQFDRGAVSPPDTDDGTRPLFRSRLPATGAAPDPFARVFPALRYILENSNNTPLLVMCPGQTNPFRNCTPGERLPRLARTMVFQATARDLHSDGNGVNGGTATRPILVEVDPGTGPFTVTRPPDYTPIWVAGATRQVTWDVAGTDAPPINCASVDVALSTNGGASFPIMLAAATPNDGQVAITVPNVTAQARLRVKCTDNVFFDIFDSEYTLSPLVVTNNDDDGPGSLRQAILDANASPDANTIRFDMFGSRVIIPATPLPTITSPVVIDGLSEGGTDYAGPPLVELLGSAAPAGTSGLVITAGTSTVTGLAISGFPAHGVVLRTNGGNVLHSLYVGQRADGVTVPGNGGYGIFIDDTAGNRIGDKGVFGENRRSIVVANEVGVGIIGASADGNALYNNYIGVGADGRDRGNRLDGVRIDGGAFNQIGDNRPLDPPLATRAGNVISGNGEISFAADGIEIVGIGAEGNRVQGNLIGLAPDGVTARGNLGSGVLVSGAPGTRIGGTFAGLENVIAANGNQGGIALVGAGASDSVIEGNLIGTDFSGVVARPNNAYGISVQSARNVIGGNSVAARNVIVGATGIYLQFAGATQNRVVGNYIGIGSDGTTPLNISGTGIEIRAAAENTIGGTAPGEGNVIAGNFTSMFIVSAGRTLVAGNTIGTNAAGTATAGASRGVIVTTASDITVGGDVAGAGNLISGHGNGGNDHGVMLADCTRCRVAGNTIGLTRDRTAVLGNGGSGVFATGAGADVLIGGTTAGAGNVIGGNGTAGIAISADNVRVFGNLVGTNAAGEDLGNGSLTGTDGIRIESGGGNLVGGTAAGEANTIAYNGGFDFSNRGFGGGVRVFGAGQRVRGNRIHDNATIGIDLFASNATPDGVNANDPCDADTGPNSLQNFPVLATATGGGGGLAIAGTLDSAPNATYTIDFYASIDCDPSGHGEGEAWLGSTTVTTGANCAAPIATTVPVTPPAGSAITATATSAAGDTSEFSACVASVGGDLLFRDSFE